MDVTPYFVLLSGEYEAFESHRDSCCSSCTVEPKECSRYKCHPIGTLGTQELMFLRTQVS